MKLGLLSDRLDSILTINSGFRGKVESDIDLQPPFLQSRHRSALSWFHGKVMRNSEAQQPAGSAGSALFEGGKPPFPVLALLLGGTLIMGMIGGWYFVRGNAPDVPTVAMLSGEEILAAVPTLDPGLQQAVRNDARECRHPMGFVTVATPGNPAGGNVVFRTSKYRSPVFHVSDVPQRIAIPHPLPDTGGVDLLSADGDAKGLLVSLYPTARMEPVNGSTTVKVFWRPTQRCKS